MGGRSGELEGGYATGSLALMVEAILRLKGAFVVILATYFRAECQSEKTKLINDFNLADQNVLCPTNSAADVHNRVVTRWFLSCEEMV